jgi:hypothetical protein
MTKLLPKRNDTLAKIHGRKVDSESIQKPRDLKLRIGELRKLQHEAALTSMAKKITTSSSYPQIQSDHTSRKTSTGSQEVHIPCPQL